MSRIGDLWNSAVSGNDYIFPCRWRLLRGMGWIIAGAVKCSLLPMALPSSDIAILNRKIALKVSHLQLVPETSFFLNNVCGV